MSPRGRGEIGDGEILFPPINNARERGGCFGAIAPSLDASRSSPCSSDRMVPPLSRSHTALPGAGIVAIKLNPTPPKCRDNAAPTLRFPVGGSRLVCSRESRHRYGSDGRAAVRCAVFVCAPEPVRELLPPPRHYEGPSRGRYRRRR
jgi:hypothetical protein